MQRSGSPKIWIGKKPGTWNDPIELGNDQIDDEKKGLILIK